MSGITKHQLSELSPTRLKRTVMLGLKSLWVHRLRSLLTMMGIVFGVMSVIAMLAIGEGLSFEAQEQIRRMGSNNIIIKSVKPAEDKSTNTQDRSIMLEYGLTYEDMTRLQYTIPSVEVVLPSRIIREDVWHGSRRVGCTIIVTVPWYPAMRNHQPAIGRFFDESEQDDKKNVCVLGAGMDRELFPIDDPIGKSVRIGQSYYQVVGVMEPKATVTGGGGTAQTSGSATKTTSADNQFELYIPLSAAKSRFGETLINRSTGSFTAERVQIHEATVQVSNLEDVIETSLIIEEILASTHKKRDYELIVPLGLLQQAERTKRIFNIVLGAIAAISLLVGGIGIMNIMLATVTERTREIGIRRALGAKQRDIVLQFLIETVLLSGVGGLLGVVLGVSIPFFITFFAEMKTIITIWSPAVAFSISALIGIVFGIYPAMRAAKMDPVEALRHE
ncbi:MAG: peptide ABC transporter permease [Candidatus Hydrogenedentota bacterium]